MTERVEGKSASQLVQLIKTIGYNQDINIELATVTSPPPSLKIKVDNMNVELEKDDLIVAEHLTKHKRTITIKKHPDKATSIRFKSASVTDSMTSAGTGPHTHDITSLELSSVQDDFTFDLAELEFGDELKKDDRVIVAEVNNGQTYIVIDRVVRY